MQVKLLKNAPKTRCYKCGTEDIQYICHHCGQLMCAKHTFFSSRTISNQTSGNNSQKKLLTVEFTKLNLHNICGEEPYHCSNCFHIFGGIPWKRILIGSILVLISLFTPSNRLGIKILSFLTGGGLVVYGVYANRERKQQALKQKPDLPVLPNFDKVKIKEILKGNITLNSNGDYEEEIKVLQGQLDTAISLTLADQERLGKYYLPKYASVEKFHAGFLVLQGALQINFYQEDISYNRGVLLSSSNPVIQLVDKIDNQPFLKGIKEHNSHKKLISLKYDLLEKFEHISFPVQLVICLIPETDQRGLEISVQWSDPELTENDEKQLRKLRISQIDSLELNFPLTWGRAEEYQPSSVILVKDSPTIIWEKIQIEKGKNRCSFKAIFENQIDPSDTDNYIRGKLKAISPEALSGLEKIQLYFPTGKLNKDFSDIETEFEADFELSLANLRYQHIKVFPDEYHNTSFNKQESLEFPGVSPNYNTIIKLTDAMSSVEQGFYVRQILENPSTINPTANIINRSWNIFGRWYQGVHPIDFQVNLIGEQNENSLKEYFGGFTRVKLTVKGTYSNEEMKEQIIEVGKRLEYLIQSIFEQLSGTEETWETKALPASSDLPSTQMKAFLEDEDE